ncbi:MAG: AMP-binding protein [Immundisolibacteraceae bacterium]|nr:AMP-binding protein [Immundisolibacteraceae bacterium]
MENSIPNQSPLAQMLATAAGRFGSREALVCMTSNRRFSFADLNHRANQLANLMAAEGYRKGDVVAMLSSNRIELVDWYFMLAKSGIVGIPINYRLSADDITGLIGSMGATGLLFETRFNDLVDQVRPASLGLRLLMGFGAEIPDYAIDYDQRLAQSEGSEPMLAVEQGEPFYFNLTSGTTGLPKSYVLNHQSNLTGSQSMAEGHDLTEQDTVLTVFPAFGRVGFAWIAGAIFAGTRNVLLNFSAPEALGVIQSEAITITNLVPTMAAMMMAEPDLENYDLSSLRGIVFAGAPLPAPIRERTRELLCPNLYEYYGMQEIGIVTLSKPAEKLAKPDSVGRQIERAEVRVIDDQGADLPVGEVGHIIARSPSATDSYYQNPEKSAQTFRDGWVHTGDLGRFDAERFLYIAGRDKDMIITGGQNVFSLEVEEVILGLDTIAECAVIGLADELWGERVTAIIVAAAGSQVSEQQIIAHCKSTLAGFKVPKQVVFQAEQLPRTPTGKVTKFVLVDRYQ